MLPILAATRVALALPDRHAGLDAIDQGLTGAEGLTAVGGAGRADHRDVPHFEPANAMLAGQLRARVLPFDFLRDGGSRRGYLHNFERNRRGRA